MKNRLLIGALLTAAFSSQALAATPPAQADTGYGSKQNYINSSTSTYVTGSRFDASKVTWYVPSRLKNGTAAPVVVLLHGKFFVDPNMYIGLIGHLTKQGVIVIFPQYEKETLGGVFAASHIDMMSKAISTTKVALDRIGAKADRNNLYVVGHSLGGLLASCWTGSGGPAPKGVMLAMPFIRDTTGQVPIQPTPLPFAQLIPKTAVPSLVISGSGDKLTGTAQAREIFNLMTGNSAAFYEAQSDAYGSPALAAVHMAPTQTCGAMPCLFWKSTTDGTPTTDAHDYRVIYAGVDALMSGQINVQFDMDKWSDGQAVTPVKTLDIKWK